MAIVIIFSGTLGHNVWQTIYDGHDRVKGKSDPLQNTVNYTLDENSNLTNVSGPENLMVSNQYDELNRMNSSTFAGSITQGFQYDPAGNMTKYTNPNNHAWNYTAGGSGLIKAVNDPLGNASSYAYDKRALPLNVSETENSGRSLNHSISYNALGNVNSTDDSMQRKWQTHYDLATQLPQDNIDPENGAVASSYDGLNRLNKGTRYINFNGSTVPADNHYEYDLNNNLVAVTDANNNRTSYQYDDKDRLTKVTYPDSRSESYAYDKNDRLKSMTDANGTIISNIYDTVGRLTSRTIAPATGIEGPTHESFTYDGQSRLVRAENENTITTLTYDNAGRLTGEKQQTKNNAVITSTYDVVSGFDNNSNKTALTYPSGKTLSITPDALDRISAIQSGNNAIAGYTYEGQDKVTGKTLGNAVQMTAAYDDGKRPTTFKYANVLTSKDIIDQAMSWNKVDLKTSETRADDNTQSKNHEYDSAYRLRKSTAAQNETEYDIDGTDNIKQVKEVKEGVTQTVNHDVNNRNQVITLGNRTLTYDNNGNLTKMTGGGTTTNYIYDYKNQLLRVESSGTQVEFMYDALGRRVQKKAVYPNSSATTKYVYDGNQVIEERDGANLLKSRYAYGNGIDEPVEIEKENAGSMKSYLPMQDTNGNVIALADNTGKLIEKVNYSAYGAPTFIYDHVAPQVDQVRVVSGKINIRFSEAVDQTSAKSAIKIKQGTNDLSGTITFTEEDKLAVFTPSSALPNALLTIVVAIDLEDINSNKLAAEFSQAFTYAGSDLMVYDRVAPEVDKITLLSGKFYVTFSEELDPASIASAIGLTYATGTINGTSTLDNPKTIIFTPSSSLSNSTEYAITVKSTVKDLSGKSLVQFSEKFIYSGSDLLIYQKPDPTEHAESYVKNTTLFQGRSLDPETGLYYFRARYLQPELGRFLQGDPMGFKDSMNPYQSFGNNPVNFSDPMGEITILVHGTDAKDAVWTKDGSPFAKYSGIKDLWRVKTAGYAHIKDLPVLKKLKAAGPHVDQETGKYNWSGENKIRARRQGGRSLANYINAIKEQYPNEPINIVAHSHGGNVFNEASALLSKPVDKTVFLGVPNQLRYKGEYLHAFNSNSSKSFLNLYSVDDSVQTYWASHYIDSKTPNPFSANATAERTLPAGDNITNFGFRSDIGARDVHSAMHGIEVAPFVGMFIEGSYVPQKILKALFGFINSDGQLTIQDGTDYGLSETMNK